MQAKILIFKVNWIYNKVESFERGHLLGNEKSVCW